MKNSLQREREADTAPVRKEHVTWDKVEQGFTILIGKMRAAKFKPKVIAGIQRGGLPLAVMLSHYFDVPFYLASREQQLVGKRMLLVDDVADDGVTLAKYTKNLPKGTRTCTLYHKPHSVHKPDFYAYQTEDWIVFPWEKKEPKRKKKLLGLF